MSTLAVATIQGLTSGASVNFPASPTAPTATLGDTSTKLATTQFVHDTLSAVSGGFAFTLGSTPITATSVVTSVVGLALDNAPIGLGLPAAGSFTTLSSNSVTSLGPVTTSSVTTSSLTTTGGSINGTSIGLVTPAPGTFTILLANTPSGGDNSTKVATTAFVQSAISASPGRLIGIRILTTNGTYTPTSGTTSVIVKAVGGGGGSGGSFATGAGQYSIGCSGGGGAYGESWFTSGFSGVTVTIGTGGTAGAVSGNGGNGGSTSFGALLVCPGGSGGLAQGAVTYTANAWWPGGNGGVAPTGANVLSLPGQSAGGSWVTAALGRVGIPGASPLGVAIKENLSSNVSGVAATVASNGYGCGAQGAFTDQSTVARAGAAGSQGAILVYEYN